ncbi:MAG: hypothetical protein GY898_18330 [Proteobacteria bacterium]|nr:hypothetical protein [Pseudomonadota bacterium]
MLASALLLPGSLAVLFGLGPGVYRVAGSAPVVGDLIDPILALVILCMLAPMLALGSAICLFLMRAKGDAIGRMYGADLLGATLGAVAVVPLMTLAPTPLIIAGAGLLPLIALALIAPPARPAAGIVGALLIASFVWGAPTSCRSTSATWKTRGPRRCCSSAGPRRRG